MSNLGSALFFIQHHRYKEAESALQQVIAADPQNAFARSLLALSLLAQKENQAAVREAEIAVRLKPDSDHGHYVHALTLLEAEQPDAAMVAIREAIRLNPEDAKHYEVLSRIYLTRRQWQKALEAVDEGLRINPEDVTLTNLRARALIQMGRRLEANQSIESALARDPENAHTHATQGWALLHQGDPEKAMVHFREALRINPNMRFAQDGIVEALKARNPIYHLILTYYLRMSRMPAGQRWMIIIGGFFGIQVASNLLNKSPQLAPILVPLMVLYFVFALLTWTGSAFFDLLLRFHRFGRLVLSRESIIASNWIAVCIVAALILFVGALLSPSDRIRIPTLWLAAQALAMMVPVSGIFHSNSPQTRKILSIYTVVLAAIIVWGVAAVLAGAPRVDLRNIFIIGWVAYSWVANILIAREK